MVSEISHKTFDSSDFMFIINNSRSELIQMMSQIDDTVINVCLTEERSFSNNQ